MNGAPLNPIKSMHGHSIKEVNKFWKSGYLHKEDKNGLYSYLHHSLVQSEWIYLFLKQKPSVNDEVSPAK